jgi:hypothetical protein
MSDFLSRLAGRSMGLAPTVQPVIPAMTAPPSREGSLAERETFLEAREGPAETGPTVSPQLSEARDSSAQTPANAPFATSLPQTRHDLVIGPAAENTSNARSVARPQFDSALDATLRRPDAMPGDAGDAESTRPAWDRSLSDSAGLHFSERASGMANRRDVAPTAPPVIRVTIGRVEVCAEFAAPKVRQAAAARPKPAAISLDDYLKQRSEGRR